MSKKILLSEYARAKRGNEGLTVREFAKKYNVSKAQVSKYECGHCDNKISYVVAKNFCKIYDISYDDFLSNFEYQNNPKINSHLVKLPIFKNDIFSLNALDLKNDIEIIDKYLKTNNISNDSLTAALTDVRRIINVMQTPVCENCEPKDLQTAIYKLRLMADEGNSYAGAYENLLVKYENKIKEDAVFTSQEIYKIMSIIESYMKVSKYDLTPDAKDKLKEITNKLNEQYYKLAGIRKEDRIYARANKEKK